MFETIFQLSGGVMKSSRYLLFLLTLVFGFGSTQSALAQSFKHVKVKGGYSLVQISAGGASTWARSTSGHPYIYKNKQFVLADSNFLCQNAVDGGTVAQPDAVWGIDCSGGIQRATLIGSTWTFSSVPGTLDHLAVGPGYQDSCYPYEVWGLNANSIYRYSYCTNSFDFVPGSLVSIAVGGGGVWGINSNNDFFGFSFVDSAFIQKMRGFTQLEASPDGVWPLSVNGDVCRFMGECSSHQRLDQFQAGSGVWGIAAPQQVFRLDAGTVVLVQIPFSLAAISVGTGGGVWGLDGSGQPHVFSTP
jgi:hypothetical protein